MRILRSLYFFISLAVLPVFLSVIYKNHLHLFGSDIMHIQWIIYPLSHASNVYAYYFYR